MGTSAKKIGIDIDFLNKGRNTVIKKRGNGMSNLPIRLSRLESNGISVTEPYVHSMIPAA